MKKKCVWKKPLFSVFMVVAAMLCFVICILLPEYSYTQESGRIQFENPESFSTSSDGKSVIVDDRESLYCMDENGNLIYALGVSQFPYEEAEMIDAFAGAQGQVYCQVAIYDKNSRLTIAEAVWEIAPDGKIVREVIRRNYYEEEYPPVHQVRIYGLHAVGENICYLYKEESGESVVTVDPDTLQEVGRAAYAHEGFGEVVKCCFAKGIGFLVLRNNGEVGTVSYEGEYNAIYKATYNIHTGEGMLLYDVCMADGNIYLLSGEEDFALYQWNGKNPERILSLKESTQTAENQILYAIGLGEYMGKPAIHMNESLYLLESDRLALYESGAVLPGSVVCEIIMKKALPVIGVVFLLLGIIFGVGCLMKWRLSILSKQLLCIIPVVVLMLGAVVIGMFVSMINLNSEDIIRETIAINEIAAAQFDAEQLEHITGYESVDDSSEQVLSEKLRTFMNGNRSDWSGNYSMALYVRAAGEKFVCIADSEGSGQFMTSSIETEEPIDTYFYENSHTFVNDVSFGEEWEKLHVILMTPIYNEDGSYDAYVLLSAQQTRLIEAIVSTGKSVLISAVIWIALLIFVITLMSAYNVKTLRRAKDVVARIAGGDFSVRVDAYAKDETGEICAGVNDMADRLEEYIKEKDRNEKFYYKFVPENFRELLHKEKFTDLALGDAQSVDLSILFCDIRAFSLNSEMMTAKESFEFVNRIYGKAGPIIRKHNGFVDKYIGDAVMALFESADDAVAAGIELYHAIVLAPDAEKEFGISSVKVGIGIHSGMARIGIVGEEERMSGTVISNTVNLSSRMESLTKQYGAGMIISKETLDRMEDPDSLSTRYLGMVQVAGVNEVAGLYEVLACQEDEKRSKREQSKAQFREAVRAFHSGEVQQSLEMFRKLAAQDPDDKAAQLYAEHIEDKIRRKDTEHNVFRFKRKG